MAHAQPVGKLPASLKLFWGSGALGVAVLMNAVTVLILFYLTFVVKLNPALAGTLILVTKLFDAVSDPIMGVISDRSNFKMGRRRPYMFIGSFVSAISFAILFTIPNFESEALRATYAFGALMLYTVGYTIFNVPFMAMSAEMTDDYHERTSLHGYRVAFVSIGSSIAGAGAPIILQAYGKDWDAHAIVGVLFSAVIFASMMTATFGTRRARAVKAVKTAFPVREQVSLLLSNHHFLVLLGVKAAQLIGIMSGAAVGLFFFVNYLAIDLRYMALFGITNTITTILAVPILTKFSKRFGKRQGYFLTAALTACVSLSWALTTPNPDMAEFLPTLLLRSAILGVCIAGNVMFAMSMLTDTIEYDARRSGMRREGVYAAMYSFTEKAAGAIGPFLVGWVLAFVGFDNSLSPDEAQSDAVRQGILFGQAYLPALMILISMVILSFYKLTEAQLKAAGGDTGISGATVMASGDEKQPSPTPQSDSAAPKPAE